MNRNQRRRARSSELSRRDILRFGAGAACFTALGPITRRSWAGPAAGGATSGPRLVVINLKGGNDGVNTLVPNHLGAYYDRRPGLALPADGGDPTLSLNSGPAPEPNFRLHPSLDYLASAYADGDLALIHKVGYPDANGSHFESETIYSRARRDIEPVGGPEASGWIARLIDVLGPEPTAAIAIDSGAVPDFKGGSSPLLSLGSNLTSFRFEVDGAYGNTNDPHRKQTVKKILAQYSGNALENHVRDAQRLGHELEQAVRDAEENYVSDVSYPNNSLGGDLLAAAKLIQGGFDTQVFYLSRGGYDHHGAQLFAQASLHSQMDQALAAFAQDMSDMGLWQDTVVVIISEFGRRNFENGSGGTDHGAASCQFVLGGPVSGGMYGEPLVEGDLLANTLEYRVDFRRVYKEIVRDHFGVGAAGLASIFPEPLEIDSNLGLFG